MEYQRINWKNESIGETPLSAENLNHMEDGIVANEEAIEEVSEIVEGKQDTLTFDDVPTKNSNNPVKSNGIYDAILNVLLTDSESGNPCVITDAFNTNAKSVKLTLNPIQSGSGTPSPSNVRPITGRTSATLDRTGKNLFTNSDEEYSGTGTLFANKKLYAAVTGALIISFDYKIITPGTQSSQSLFYAILNNVRVAGGNIANFTDTTPSSNWVHLSLQMNRSITFDAIELYSSATIAIKNIMVSPSGGDFEPYRGGESITRTYGTTVYGGTDDVTGDGVISEYGMVDLGSLNWYSGSGFFDTDAIPAEGATTDILCSEYPTNSVEYYIQHPSEVGIAISLSQKVRLYNSSYTTPNEVKTAMNGVVLAYKLVTPTSIPLTAQNITLLHGDNVLTTDADSIKASYSADIALYIDKKIAEGISQGNRSLSKGGSSEWAEEPKEEIKEESEETPEINEK